MEEEGTEEQQQASEFDWNDDGGDESSTTMHMDDESESELIPCAPPSASGVTRQFSNCNADELMPRVQRRVAAVAGSDLLCLTGDEAMLMLRSFNWDQHKLEERYFEDQDALRASLGVSAGPDPPRCLRACSPPAPSTALR